MVTVEHHVNETIGEVHIAVDNFRRAIEGMQYIKILTKEGGVPYSGEIDDHFRREMEVATKRLSEAIILIWRT